MNRDYDL
jgi:superfamily II DNA/RNA helicase